MKVRWLRPALRLPPAYRRLALAGWILYALSWGTPALRAGQVHLGAEIFLTTIKLAVSLLLQASSLAAFAVGLFLLGGWLANFSILLQLPVQLRILWSLLAWVPVALALHAMHPATVSQAILSVLFFWPWAIGITLIHAAAIAEARQGASEDTAALDI
ncbi:MAG TPA: hypothetical protein VFO44_16050 [Steroidobacteraceae bacterium]|nr:hypothetical protein [Steroidobacteraceae bacterium]